MLGYKQTALILHDLNVTTSIVLLHNYYVCFLYIDKSTFVKGAAVAQQVEQVN